MSLYNQIFGFNTKAAKYLEELMLDPERIVRMRDAYLINENDEIVLHIFTRLGGLNKHDFSDAVSYLRSHVFYFAEWDDTFDNTYCTFVFRLPRGMTIDQDVLYNRDQMPMVKYQRLLAEMASGKMTDEVKKAMAVGTRVFKI